MLALSLISEMEELVQYDFILLFQNYVNRCQWRLSLVDFSSAVGILSFTHSIQVNSSRTLCILFD